MFQLRDWAEAERDFEEATKWAYLAAFTITRNDNADTRVYEQLIQSNLYVPADVRCLERTGDNGDYAAGASGCSEERYYYADSIIRAVELQQALVEDKEVDTSQLLYLHSLAQMAVTAVYGVDGKELILVQREDTYSMEPNHTIKPRYRWGRYLKIMRAMEERINEECGGCTT